MSEPRKFIVLSGVEGPSLYLDNHRIAGPKPWGGGTVLHEFQFSDADLRDAGLAIESEPRTEAGRSLHWELTESGWSSFATGRIEAIEREAVAAFLASPEAAEGLAGALVLVAYPDFDLATDDPPVLDVGDLSDSGLGTAPDVAAAILAAWQQERAKIGD